jgi:serine/threonine-protein kinase
MLPALALIIFFFSLRDFFLRGDIYALPWTLGAGAILWSAYLEIYPWLTTAPAPTIYYPPPEPVSVETASASLSQETRTSTGAPAPRADAVPSAATPVLGSALIGKKYEMVHRIGEGGMGLVYAGRDFELGRFVAIKKMRPELKLNAREKKRFMREAQLSAALHHPCIVEIYDIAEQDGEVYLIFEYVDGQTLDKRLDSGPMTAEELKPPLKFVCKALEFAHSKKVVHRDLKPSNIMITRQGFAKVMDFGIAREIKDTMSRLTRLDTSGTAAYMAPEQELGKFDGRADIYALGVTLYEALSGTPPFPGPNFLRQKELMEFKPLAEAAPTAPKEFCDAIERCLSFDANERFQTIAQFAAEAKT